MTPRAAEHEHERQARGAPGRPRAPTAGASAGRRAAIGETRVASRAGTSEASTVTSVPTSSGTTHDRDGHVDRVGQRDAEVEAAEHHSAPGRARRRHEPDHRGDRPEDGRLEQHRAAQLPLPAPTQRSSASVRVRWATSTWNVLAMTSAATSSATAANPSTTVTSTLPPSENCATACCGGLVLGERLGAGRPGGRPGRGAPAALTPSRAGDQRVRAQLRERVGAAPAQRVLRRRPARRRRTATTRPAGRSRCP